MGVIKGSSRKRPRRNPRPVAAKASGVAGPMLRLGSAIAPHCRLIVTSMVHAIVNLLDYASPETAARQRKRSCCERSWRRHR